MDMSGMDMSSSSDASMGMTMMGFTNSHTTSLYSPSWTPKSEGGYAGTCIFLVLLATTFRGLFAIKAVLEEKWRNQARNRRYVVVRGQGTEASRIDADPDAKTGKLVTANGVEENVKVVRSDAKGAIPFRLSVDVPRAFLVMVTFGVGYLL